MKKEKELYNNNERFTDPLPTNLDGLKDRVLVQNKASMIIVDGFVGDGKTTMSVLIADYLNGEPIKFEDSLSTGGLDFIKKLKVCHKKKTVVCIYDEAGDFNKRASLTRFNATLNRVFETYRAYKILVILTLPDFSVLDNNMFTKGIPRMLIHCEKRNSKYGRFRAYSLSRIFYLLKWKKKLTNPNKAFSLVTPNFYGLFKNLDSERAKELAEFSIGSKLTILDDAMNTGNLSYFQIAKYFDVTIDVVKKKMNELGIEHDTIVRNKKYFKTSVLRELEDYLNTGSSKK